MKCPVCRAGNLSSIEGRGFVKANGLFGHESAHSYHFDCGHSSPAPSVSMIEAIFSAVAKK